MSSSLPTPTPGIILSFLHPSSPSPSTIDTDTDKWTLLPHLFPSHIPGAKTPSLYTAADPTYPKQHLLVCAVDDVARVRVQHVLRLWGDEKGVEGRADVRVYAGVDVFEKDEAGNDDGPAHTLLVALMQPAPGAAGAAELDAWYRDEHNGHMAQQPGWRRTRRYALVAQQRSGAEAGKEREFASLAVHEFDEGNRLGDTVRPLEPVSEWTRKVMSEAEGIDAAIYRKVGGG